MESNEKNQANGKEIQSKPQKELLKSVVVKNYSIPFWGLGMLVLAIVVLVVAFIVVPTSQNDNKQAEIVTVSTLQEIINVSELSTFTAVYNGIAQVMNADDPE